MLFSALESLVFTVYLLYILLLVGVTKTFKLIFTKPVISFCFTFTIIFAFAVGLNSFNFGSLVRYKIQLLPFLLGRHDVSKDNYYYSSRIASNALPALNTQRFVP